MGEPTVTFGVNESGHIVYKATNDGVLLSKEEAERVAAYISELKELVRDLMKFTDCYVGIPLGDEADFFDAVERLNERIDELGIEVEI